tara:strand:+ start:445 stop:591 length:147 start_codon:yes stop_codon:yes gene_type:complete
MMVHRVKKESLVLLLTELRESLVKQVLTVHKVQQVQQVQQVLKVLKVM